MWQLLTLSPVKIYADEKSTPSLTPFLSLDKQVNGAKGRLMEFGQPTDIDKIRTLAEDAVRLDTVRAQDALLRSIQVGFAIFDYLNTPEGVFAWNAVRQQMRTQLGHIRAVHINTYPELANIIDWWERWFDDYFGTVERFAQNWARDAITAAGDIFTEARESNPNAAITIFDSVVATLTQMYVEIQSRMSMPPDTRQGGNGPPPPGGSVT
jgi:chitinase